MSERQSARMSKITNDGLNVWHRMLYSCTNMASVGVKGLRTWTLSAEQDRNFSEQTCSSRAQ